MAVSAFPLVYPFRVKDLYELLPPKPLDQFRWAQLRLREGMIYGSAALKFYTRGLGRFNGPSKIGMLFIS